MPLSNSYFEKMFVIECDQLKIKKKKFFKQFLHPCYIIYDRKKDFVVSGKEFAKSEKKEYIRISFLCMAGYCKELPAVAKSLYQPAMGYQ